jgi:hypothetical protein
MAGGGDQTSGSRYLKEALNTVHPGLLRARKVKNVVFTFLHFQWPLAIENGGTSLCRGKLRDELELP